MDAGLVSFDVGPAPAVGFEADKGKFTLTSTKFKEPVVEYFDVMVRARIDMFEPERSTSKLVRNMLKSGVATPYQNGPFKAGGLNVNEKGHIITAQGETLTHLYARATSSKARTSTPSCCHGRTSIRVRFRMPVCLDHGLERNSGQGCRGMMLN